jgi:uncharacterized protein with ParB-like and HNH nuclease domain
MRVSYTVALFTYKKNEEPKKICIYDEESYELFLYLLNKAKEEKSAFITNCIKGMIYEGVLNAKTIENWEFVLKMVSNMCQNFPLKDR